MFGAIILSKNNACVSFGPGVGMIRSGSVVPKTLFFCLLVLPETSHPPSSCLKRPPSPAIILGPTGCHAGLIRVGRKEGGGHRQEEGKRVPAFIRPEM